MTNELTYTMTVGRDYRTSSQYEYIIWKGDEEVVAREGYFKNHGAAKRAGLKAHAKLIAEEPQGELF